MSRGRQAIAKVKRGPCISSYEVTWTDRRAFDVTIAYARGQIVSLNMTIVPKPSR
jgi:hypothetical protein